MLPLYVSLVVGVLTSHVNRYASLIGGCNAVLYALVYFYYRLYGSAAYAILISCPLQIMTFIRWSKNAYRHSTQLIRMTWKQRAVLTGGLALAWAVLYAVLTSLDSSYRLLDNTLTLIGVLATILMLLAYVEYTYLTLASGLVSLVLFLTMCRETPEQLTYLIYSVYSLICCIRSIIHIHALYTEQRSIPKESS